MISIQIIFTVKKMVDIEALLLLHQRCEALNNLPNPADPNISFEKYEETASRTMTKTQTDIETVSKYATEILEELENVRELVKNCSVKIGEQILSLMVEGTYSNVISNFLKVNDLNFS